MCWWHNHSGYYRINGLQNTKEQGFIYQMVNYCARKKQELSGTKICGK